MNNKRLLANSSFSQILDDDLMNEAKLRNRADNDEVITLDVSPNVGDLRASWLSPNLRKRFSSTLVLG